MRKATETEKHLVDLTDAEIRSIVAAMFVRKAVQGITRAKQADEAVCTLVDAWAEDGAPASRVTLRNPFAVGAKPVEADFGVSYEDVRLYKLLCFAKGVRGETLGSLDALRWMAAAAGAETGIDIRVSQDPVTPDAYWVWANGSQSAGPVSLTEALGAVALLAQGALCAAKMAVRTTAGTLVAERQMCPESPSVMLWMTPAGAGESCDLAMAECHESPDTRGDDEAPGDVALYVWKDFAEEWADRIPLTAAKAKEAFAEE